jgi:hypothetical protein
MLDAKQHATVAQGMHTIQTYVHADQSLGNILAWEIDYTIYELKPHTVPDD